MTSRPQKCASLSQGRIIDALLEILELISLIERQTSGLTREAFLQDFDVQDATAYRLLAIGGAMKGLSEEIKDRYLQIPWRMRNILAHGYFIRESDIIWVTIKPGLPELARCCRDEIDRLPPLR